MVAPTNRLDCNGITEGEALDLVNTDLNQIIQSFTGAGKAMAAAALRGAKGARITGTLNDNYTLAYTDTAAASASVQTYFRSRATPTVNNEFVRIRSASGNMGRIFLSTALALILQDGGGNNIAWSGGTLTATNNTKYRCQVQVTKGTTTANGTISGQIYDDSGTLLRSGTSSTANTGTADATTGQAGKVVTGSNNVDMDIDEFAFITGTTAEIDDVASNFAPNAGPDQTTDSYVTVELTATDLESGVVWTQTAGSPTVTFGGSGNNRTFVAPAVRAGTTLTFTATDAGALTDTCTVTVYPHNEWAVVGGVEVPINYVAASLPDPIPQLATTGLVAFYDADDTTGPDGTLVAAAPSGIVGHPDAVQATGGNQPTLRANAINGHKAWDFGATNTTKRLALQGIVLDAARNKTDLILSVVYKLPGSAVTGTCCMFGLSNNSTGGRVAIFSNVATTNVHRAGGRRLDADSFGQVDSAAGATIGETAILTAEYRWGTSDLYLYKNGTLVASSTSFQTSGSTSDTSSLAGYIGCNGAAGEFFQGMIGQVIVKDVADPTGTVKQNIWDYQMYRYGL